MHPALDRALESDLAEPRFVTLPSFQTLSKHPHGWAVPTSAACSTCGRARGLHTAGKNAAPITVLSYVKLTNQLHRVVFVGRILGLAVLIAEV
jgi:hypothetical protein